MKASFTMLDILGVNQHHDAITGTGNQAVANDYAFNIFKSMSTNNAVYQQLIEDAAFKIAGINTTTPWEWCFKENSTYLDCPIANPD
jgi:hypothetical protein